MKKEIDIHNYPRLLKRAEKNLEKSDISDRNKELILEFRDYCSLEGEIGLPRTIRYLGVLRDWALLLNKDYDVACTEDIKKAVRVVQENEKYSEWTKITYKTMLKRFYKWLKKTEDSPEEVKWISTRMKRTDKKILSSSELITEEEVKKMVNAAEHPRDKAFISILYESGARVSEVASLQIKNVQFDEHGAILTVQGKTGSRHIRIISSVSYLSIWAQSHPLKEDPNAPLWINIGTTKHNSQITYNNIRYIVKKLADKAGIEKKTNPHMFRHSRATYLANHLTEFQMNQYFGWVQGSGMPATYVHLSGKNLDNSLLSLNGVKQENETQESSISPRICPRCETINSHDAKFCIKCGGILDVKTAMELEKKSEVEKNERSNADNIMDVLMKDKEFQKLFAKKVKELGVKVGG
ncbi:tyrosine-type recombinase/integrase [Candidatus Woesearchaeota archaeon]|nr:tyrosine-type recombinase/integrase [Candidatus Woesearchaeota archaeon]